MMGYIEKENLANRENYGNKRSLSDIDYIVIHYTANDGDTDENNGKYFHNNVVKASAHDFVDSNSVTHSVPYNYIAYSVGKVFPKDKNGGKYLGKCKNANSVSIELCDDLKNGSIYPTQATINNAIALTVKLCKKFNVNPKTNVIRHYDATYKNCPQYWLDNNKWKKEFLNKVISEYNKGKPNAAKKVANAVKNTVSKIIKKNSIPKPPFEVYVKIPDLNVREHPNNNGKPLGVVGYKTVKIDKVQNGWGRIYKSGWIYLENPNYCNIGKKITLTDSNTKKSINEIAKEVINGKWGNGEERKRKLEKAGYDYKKVQKEVNRIIK